MSLNIYLTFNGNCREAFDHYKSVFGGEFMALQTFGDAPPAEGMENAGKDRIMHVSLPIGENVLMGSDTPEGTDDATIGTNFSISIAPESKEQCDELIGKLSEGGEVTMPMQETFWNAYFGMCRDRFQVNWMFNHELETP